MDPVLRVAHEDGRAAFGGALEASLGAVEPLDDHALLAATRCWGWTVPTTGDFLATWAVELAVHQLDVAREIPVPPPTPASLGLARRTVEALAEAGATRARRAVRDGVIPERS